MYKCRKQGIPSFVMHRCECLISCTSHRWCSCICSCSCILLSFSIVVDRLTIVVSGYVACVGSRTFRHCTRRRTMGSSWLGVPPFDASLIRNETRGNASLKSDPMCLKGKSCTITRTWDLMLARSFLFLPLNHVYLLDQEPPPSYEYTLASVLMSSNFKNGDARGLRNLE